MASAALANARTHTVEPDRKNKTEMMRPAIQTMLLAILLTAAPTAVAAKAAPNAEFLFVGSYHMGNPGQDVHNMRADDVTSDQRQREIREVARLLEAYKPTKVMVEVATAKQGELQQRFDQSCGGSRGLTRNEVEQLGFRIACDLGLSGVVAVDWNELGPIRDEDSVDYLKAVERHGQQQTYKEHHTIGAATSAQDQRTLEQGSVLDMLRRLNSPSWLEANGRAYYRIGMLGTPQDPIGANWVQLWYGRNLMIFNNIARRTEPGDRILVIYGAGHGNHLRQLAADSGVYRVHDPLAWLSGDPADSTTHTSSRSLP
jgi:hypothetical protein